MERGKLIIIEGTDGCGKETQSKLLREYFEREGAPVLLLSFPNYESESSGPVKLFLNKHLGPLDTISAMQASMLYAVDRFCTIKTLDIENLLANGTNIICDRYTESNLICHAWRLKDNEMNTCKREFISEVHNLEYCTLGIPRPDHVFFLDMLPAASAKLRENRQNKITNGDEQDLHESNPEFLSQSYIGGLWLANELGWDIIPCNDEVGEPLTIPLVAKNIRKRISFDKLVRFTI